MNEAAAVEEVSAEESAAPEVGAPDIRPVDDWRDGLTADVRNGLGDVQSVEDLAKGYVLSLIHI